uniref:Uncharacterized protein n=1 Tax=Kalanchoe fedtschenkoi TaxID=63787 RepID=A0A7N0T4Y2_KALFE
MTRFFSTSAKMSSIWRSKNPQVQQLREFSKLVINQQEVQKRGACLSTNNITPVSQRGGGDLKSSGGSSWVPHPRTGIYVPRGHESVMDGVPDDAAMFSGWQTCWFRHAEGADKAYPETAADHYFI